MLVGMHVGIGKSLALAFNLKICFYYFNICYFCYSFFRPTILLCDFGYLFAYAAYPEAFLAPLVWRRVFELRSYQEIASLYGVANRLYTQYASGLNSKEGFIKINKGHHRVLNYDSCLLCLLLCLRSRACACL